MEFSAEAITVGILFAGSGILSVLFLAPWAAAVGRAGSIRRSGLSNLERRSSAGLPTGIGREATQG